MMRDEAIEIATRALRRGSCSVHKIATEGCRTCEAIDAAIKTLSELASAEREVLDLVLTMQDSEPWCLLTIPCGACARCSWQRACDRLRSARR